MTTYYVDPAAAGDDDGTSWTDAWPSLQTAADTAVAGDIVYCRGTQTLAAAIDFDTKAGTAAGGYIKFIGCNSSGNNDGTRFVLDGNSAATNCIVSGAIGWVWLENIECKNATGDGVVLNGSSAAWVLLNVISHDNGTSGCEANYPDDCIFLKCAFYDNGSDGLRELDNSAVVASSSHGNSGDGFDTLRACSFEMCAIYGNTGSGVVDAGTNTFTQCVFHANGTGISLGTVVGASCFVGCRITGNTTGMSVNAAQRAKLLNCYFGGNTTDISGTYDALRNDGVDQNTLAGSDTDNGYVASASDDFNLAPGATGRSVAVELD